MDPIELIITLDDEGVVSGSARVKDEISGVSGVVDQYGNAFKSAGAVAEESANKTAGSSHLASVAVAKLGEDMGIPFRAAHMLGTRVTQMASSEFPALIGAFTATAIGGAVLVGVVGQLIESHKKHEEEITKEISALEGQLSDMEKLRLKTLEVLEAEKLQSEFASNTLYGVLPEKIEAVRKKVESLRNEYQKLLVPGQVDSSGLISGNFIERAGPAWDTYRNKVDQARNALFMAQAELENLTAKQQALSGKGKASVAEESNPFWQQDDQKKWLASMQTDYITARGYQITYDQARLENAKATGASLAETQKMEMDVFDETTSKMIVSAKNRDEAEATLATRSVQRETLVTQQKKALYQQDMQNKAAMSQGISQTMDQLYTLSGQKMQAFFLFSRAAAASDAFINYQLAAAKAVGQTGLFGIDMQTYFEAMSYLAPALIMAQAFASPPGGASATGTYSASTTGLPTSSTGPAASTTQSQPPTINVTVQTLDPSAVNWDRLTEEQIVPALSRAYDRNVVKVQMQ